MPYVVNKHFGISPVVAVLLLLLLVSGMAGCGVSTGANGGGVGTSTGTATPGTKAGANGCATVAGGGIEVTAPAHVLTVKDVGHVSEAHVGDMVQVRLPAAQRWKLGEDGEGTLESLQPAGYWDVKASACVWNFRAVKVGATTVSFGGTAICKPGQPCPQYVVVEEFPLTVV